ncbi:hypothetical protein ACJDU8_17760 [Clostridium sp. WILCCON 0269]|uniref:Uncharacterized protein n=1 Tax=Candidatus Clostridium eludens TaxID=3381663 RepID=A0ABW8SQG7_9CLOT
MKLREIFKFALNRVGEHEGDRQITNIVISGINAGYKIIAITNKKTKIATITAEADTPVTLPADFISLVMLQKEGAGGGRLSPNDYFNESNILLVTNPDVVGDLTMYYNYIPVDLVYGKDDEEEPSIQAAYHIALASYAAYYYFMFKKELNAATMCLSEFNAITGLAETTEMNSSQPNSQSTNKK